MASQSKEIWKPVSGYESAYEVSSLGQVRSLPKQRTSWKTVLRKPQPDGKGRLKVILSLNGRRRSYYVHQLVAEAFLGECPVGCEVNHVYGNPSDNSVCNLEYLTPLENRQHAWRTGLMRSVIGERHYNSKLTESQVRMIRELAATTSMSQIARTFGVCRVAISDIVNRKNWKHID